MVGVQKAYTLDDNILVVNNGKNHISVINTQPTIRPSDKPVFIVPYETGDGAGRIRVFESSFIPYFSMSATAVNRIGLRNHTRIIKDIAVHSDQDLVRQVEGYLSLLRNHADDLGTVVVVNDFFPTQPTSANDQLLQGIDLYTQAMKATYFEGLKELAAQIHPLVVSQALGSFMTGKTVSVYPIQPAEADNPVAAIFHGKEFPKTGTLPGVSFAALYDRTIALKTQKTA